MFWQPPRRCAKSSRKKIMSETMNSRPLVLLHGWGMHRQTLAPLARHLGEDRDTALIDLPGHGGRRDLLEGLSSWLEPIISQIEPIANPVDLVGWSLGGMLGLALADERPDMVRRLILIGSTPKFVSSESWDYGLPTGQVRAMARQMKRDAVATMKSFVELMVPVEDAGNSEWQAWQKDLLRPEFFPDQAGSLAGLELLQHLDLRQRLATIEQPVLVIHGERDRVTPVAAGRYLADQLPNATWQPVPRGGHAPFYPLEEELSATIMEFCR